MYTHLHDSSDCFLKCAVEMERDWTGRALRSNTGCWLLTEILHPLPEVLQRSNSRKNVCETSCRVRSVPRCFNELRLEVVMAWKRSSVRSRPGPPNHLNNLADSQKKRDKLSIRWFSCCILRSTFYDIPRTVQKNIDHTALRFALG